MKPIVIVVSRGKPEFPRTIVANSLGEVWDGQSWDKDRSKARLFHSGHEAARVAVELQRVEFPDAKVLAFYQVPLKLLVRSNTPVEPEQVQEWARRAVQLQVFVDQSGVGPREDCLVEVITDWNEFRPTYEKVDEVEPP